VNLTGGPPQILCATTPAFANGTWNRNGVIVFSDQVVLKQVSAAGGEPVAITQLDGSQQEISHRWPYFLPDGRHFLYSILRVPDKHAIVIGSLGSAGYTRLIDVDSMVAYAPPGFLI